MKAKLKTIGIVLISLVTILCLYLINIDNSNDDYESYDSIKSSANYVSVEVVEEKIDPIVFDGKTLMELSDQINKSLNSTISGKGELIASYCIEKGIDPYMATAIILQETGCKWECSYLVNACNNVGGQKGEGCGGYNYYSTIDEGITSFIDNLYDNYISIGLITLEDINEKYALDQNWHIRVNNYIENIKAQ